MDNNYRVTGVGESPTVERSHRMRNYATTMGIRMACVLGLPFVRGWFWVLLLALGAVFLPYFAVVVANTKSSTPVDAPERVGPLELTGETPEASASEPAAPVLLVFDADGNEETPGDGQKDGP